MVGRSKDLLVNEYDKCQSFRLRIVCQPGPDLEQVAISVKSIFHGSCTKVTVLETFAIFLS